MESTERLVRTWMASGRDEEIAEIVSGMPNTLMYRRLFTPIMADISNDRTTLINIVKALGEYLTSEENDLRRKGKDFSLNGFLCVDCCMVKALNSYLWSWRSVHLQG